MIIPIRCFTCGNVLGSKYNTYKKLTKEKNKDNKEIIISDVNINKVDDNNDIFKKINIHRYCCKRHMISHVDLLFNI